MLIRGAEIWRHGLGDVRIAAGMIAQVGALEPVPGEVIRDAGGSALLPGLHDHHIHLPALAASRASLRCGPPDVHNPAQLAAALAGAPGVGWVRGIGYHESVMGLPDSAALDALLADRPLRLQHRSGRMWLFNSAGLEALLALAEPPPGMERIAGRFTGRLFDEDRWLRDVLRAAPPEFCDLSRELSRFGVTGVTEMGPANDAAIAAHFAAQHACGALQQRVVLAGSTGLANAAQQGWELGPVKLHLHEAAMPDWDQTLALVSRAHGQDRGLAVHCTTEVELVYTLALFEAAGTMHGDRIEHASLATDEQLARIAALGLPIVVQPHFIRERGDEYLAEIPSAEQDALYRLRGVLDAGITLSGGSDAPFGSADPWAAMAAATDRRTRSGRVIGGREALDPEQALALFLADPLDLRRERRIAPGERADLCLLDRPWGAARNALSAEPVLATWIAGRLVHDGIDQPQP